MASLEQTFFPERLIDYVQKTTSEESQLLKNIRTETQTSMPMPQMLSGPVEGTLLNILVKISGAKLALELGTFTGYAALHMAQALPIDGKLITCELDPDTAAIAQRYFNQSPDGHKIQLETKPCLEVIDTIDQPLDFVFIDADKNNYPIYFEKLVPMMKKDGLIVVDNALWSGDVIDPKDEDGQGIAKLNQMAKEDPRVDAVMLTVRDGILLCRKNC